MPHDDVESNAMLEGLLASGISDSTSTFPKKSWFNISLQAGGIKASIFTLVTAIIGAGILSLPYALAQTGIVLGLSLIVCGGFITYFSIHLLIVSCDGSGKSTYIDMAEYAYGRWCVNLARSMLVLNLLGTAAGYTLLSGSLFPLAFNALGVGSGDYNEKVIVTVAIAVVIVLPLSLLRNLSSLRFSALFGFSCIIYLSIVVVYKYVQFCFPSDGSPRLASCLAPKGESELVHWDIGRILSAVPLVVYAFTCQPQVVPIFVELKNPLPRRKYKVILRGILSAMAVYLPISICAYLTFRQDTMPNFLKNDYRHDTALVLGGFGYALSVTLVVPICVVPCRALIADMLWTNEQGKDLSNLRHVSLTLLILAIIVPIAAFATDISKVTSVLGATTNPVICYVLPGMYYLRLAEQPSTQMKVLVVLMMVVMGGLSVVSLGDQIRKIAIGQS